MPRQRALLEWLTTDRRAALPLQEQIGRQLRAAIVDGRLPAGTTLPSSRVLARDIGVSRGTITSVYDRLLGESLLEVRGRSTTCVAADAAGSAAPNGTAEAGEDAGAETMPPPHPAFLPGMPALDLFPVSHWARLVGGRFRQMSFDLAGEGTHVGGYQLLRQALAAHLRTARGVVCEPRQILVVSSTRAALSSICRVLTRPGDRGLVEDPGYFIVGRALADFGIEPLSVPVDGEGMVVTTSLPAARLAYVTPTHQMPLGVRLSDRRAAELIDWAGRGDGWIVEDDYDSEFRYVGEAVAALQASDPSGRVLYVSTFAKLLFPSLRLAFMVVPKAMAKAFERAVFLNGHEPPLHIQAALADFIGEGGYAAHIRRARRICRRRQQLLVEELNRHLAGLVALDPPSGGMNIVVPLPAHIAAETVQAEAAKQALHVRPLSYYAQRLAAPNALHLGFAALPERLIEPSVRRLAGIVRGLDLDR